MMPDWVRAANPPVASASPADKVKWLRAFVRSIANDMALIELYGTEPFGPCSGQAEALLICISMAEQIGATRDMGIMAARAEWADAKRRAHVFAESLRKAVWTLGRDRAAGGEILARAEAVNSQSYWRNGIELPAEDLLSITRQIAVAAATGRRPHVS